VAPLALAGTGEIAPARAALTTPARGAPGNVVPGPAQQDISFAALGLDNINVTGIDSTVDVFLPRPQGPLQPTGGFLRLLISHSSLLAGDLSTLSAVVNGTNVGSIFLTRQNSAQTVVRFAVPTALLLPDQVNHVQLRVHMELAQRICLAPDNPALNAHVDRASLMHYALSAISRQPEARLEQYPAPFVEAGQTHGPPLALALPQRPADDTLTAALRLTASLAQQASGSHLVPILRRAGHGNGPENEIVLGTPWSHPRSARRCAPTGLP